MNSITRCTLTFLNIIKSDTDIQQLRYTSDMKISGHCSSRYQLMLKLSSLKIKWLSYVADAIP